MPDNMVELDVTYLRFIEKYHPRYSSDDRVLLCDILFRYLSNDEVSNEDLKWIKDEFDSKKEVLQELKRLEINLFSEALGYYYANFNLIQL